MAGYRINDFYRPSQLTVDTHTQNHLVEDDDESTLDENILDSGLEMSTQSRRDSYAASAMVSVKLEDWQSNSHSNNPYFTNNFGIPNAFAHQAQNQWSMQNNDGMPQQFQDNSYRTAQTQVLFSHAPQQSIFSPAETVIDSMPGSPSQDWSVCDPVEQQQNKLPTRMRQNDPGLRSHSPLMRRDGIRKKNARFDIPPERNLNNIEALIQASTDEQETKELKQQKRLLRNRQAALDSRQRKKQHTERLEDEKKAFTTLISDLEEELNACHIQADEMKRKEQQYNQMVQSLIMEKEEMIRVHTLETGDLRKKVSVLTEHVQRLESAALAEPPAQGFTNEFADIDSITMDGAWDGMSFLNEYTDSEVKVEAPPHNDALIGKLSDEAEKPAAQGILLMLLLFGAFVASKGSSPSLPRVSDDVAAAGAQVLSDIFSEAGVSSATTAALPPLSSASTNSWSGMSATHVNMAQLSSGGFISGLGDFDSLSKPSRDQEHEQLFGMSAAQYNAANNQGFMHDAPAVKSTSFGRRNLAESLASMRSGNGKKTDVYTRSLLWDQVPQDVVRKFAQMVQESEANHQIPNHDALG